MIINNDDSATNCDNGYNPTIIIFDEFVSYETVTAVDYVPAVITKTYHDVQKYIFGQRAISGWIWNKRFKEYQLVIKYLVIHITSRIPTIILKLRRRFYWSGFCSENRGLHWDCTRK